MPESLTLVQVPPTLKPAHMALLRRYWHAGRSGLGSMGGPQALDLTALGYLEMPERGHGLQLRITDKGIAALHAETEANRARRAPHHHLGDRLATWLSARGRLCWTNAEFKAVVNDSTQFVRPDVFSIEATYNPARIDSAVHEVKVSRSDFLADIAKPSKRAGYASISEKFYYVAPDGMLDPSEMPDGAGLLVERGDDFVLAKRAKKRRIELQPEVYLAMILKRPALQQVGAVAHEAERAD